jgi:hypothetical protein
MRKLENPSSPLNCLFFRPLIIVVISSTFVGVKNIKAESFCLSSEYLSTPGVKLDCSPSAVSVKHVLTL